MGWYIPDREKKRWPNKKLVTWSQYKDEESRMESMRLLVAAATQLLIAVTAFSR
jgi:hypothetical protein